MPSRQENLVSTTDRLVAAATELFYRRGFNAVSVDDIAEASRVTKTTLYRHFTSKDQLAAVCLQRLSLAEHDAWRRIAATARGDPAAELRALVAHCAARLARPDFRGSPFANAAAELTTPDHPGRLAAEQFETELRAHLRALCEQAHSARPEVLADGLFLLLHGAAASRHFSAPAGPAAALSDIAADLMATHLPPARRRMASGRA